MAGDSGRDRKRPPARSRAAGIRVAPARADRRRLLDWLCDPVAPSADALSRSAAAGDAVDVAAICRGLRHPEELAAARRHLASADPRRDRERGPALLPAFGLRLERDRDGLGAVPKRGRRTAGGPPDLDADREERGSVAGPHLAP